MLHNCPLLASVEAYLAHHVSKKLWGIFDTCTAKYASHVTYCSSLEATLSRCVLYLTLCRDRFTVCKEWLVLSNLTVLLLLRPFLSPIIQTKLLGAVQMLRQEGYCYCPNAHYINFGNTNDLMSQDFFVSIQNLKTNTRKQLLMFVMGH
jgi:hypothetical protein